MKLLLQDTNITIFLFKYSFETVLIILTNPSYCVVDGRFILQNCKEILKKTEKNRKLKYFFY